MKNKSVGLWFSEIMYSCEIPIFIGVFWGVVEMALAPVTFYCQLACSSNWNEQLCYQDEFFSQVVKLKDLDVNVDIKCKGNTVDES